MEEKGKYSYDFSDQVILVVEDNPMSFKLISAILSQVKATIVHASNGRQAIEACEAGDHFDLILMDMQMPEMNGLEATREIKRIRPEMKIVATTANIYGEDEEACREAGCDGFVTKPLKFRKLYEVMQSFFDQQA